MKCRSSIACLAALAAITVSFSALADDNADDAADQTRCGFGACGAPMLAPIAAPCGCAAPVEPPPVEAPPPVAACPFAVPIVQPLCPQITAVQTPPMVFPGICVPDTTVTIPGINVPGFAIPGPTIPVLSFAAPTCGCAQPGFAGPEGPGAYQQGPAPEQAGPQQEPEPAPAPAPTH